ncbi:hypothetical protein BKA62DRAFT_678496 [Auriculariales sp. MPI-PUGE-AT-0066]|nr:hypothetical protein BKA62DRAFT_678496 [Auriculariales sp. MPI-PUGE-AT-0066]
MPKFPDRTRGEDTDPADVEIHRRTQDGGYLSSSPAVVPVAQPRKINNKSDPAKWLEPDMLRKLKAEDLSMAIARAAVSKVKSKNNVPQKAVDLALAVVTGLAMEDDKTELLRKLREAMHLYAKSDVLAELAPRPDAKMVKQSRLATLAPPIKFAQSSTSAEHSTSGVSSIVVNVGGTAKHAPSRASSITESVRATPTPSAAHTGVRVQLKTKFTKVVDLDEDSPELGSVHPNNAAAAATSTAVQKTTTIRNARAGASAKPVPTATTGGSNVKQNKPVAVVVTGASEKLASGTVKDVPWGTEVFRGLGCNPEIVGLHPKGRRVQCAIEAHHARGRRASESITDVNGEDRIPKGSRDSYSRYEMTRSQSYDIGEGQGTSSEVGLMQLLDEVNEMLVALSEVREAGEAAVASGDHDESAEEMLQVVKEAGAEEHAVYLRSARVLEVLRAGGVSDVLIQAGETEVHQALWAWIGAVRAIYDVRVKVVPPMPNVEAHTEDESDVDMVEATVSHDKGKARARTPSEERVLVLESESEDDGSRLLAYPKNPTAASFWRRVARNGRRVPVGAGDVFGAGDPWWLRRVGGPLAGSTRKTRGVKRGRSEVVSEDEADAPSTSRPVKIRKAKSAAEDKIRAAVQAEDHRLLDAIESASRSLASIAGSLVDHTTILFRIDATLTEQQHTSRRMSRSVFQLRKMLGARAGATGARAGASASGAAAAGAPS